MEQQAVIDKSANPKYGWIVLLVVFLAGITAPLNMAKVTTLAPVMMEVFEIGPGMIGWVIAMFYILGFVMAFPAAGMTNKLGIKKTVSFALIVSILGSVIGAIATNLPIFMFSRVLEGMGMGVMGVVGVAAISPWFAPSKRGLPMGIWTTWVALPMFVGPIVFAAMVESMGDWRPVWWMTSIFGIITLVLFVAFYKDPTFVYDENENVVQLGKSQMEELERPSIKKALAMPVVWILGGIVLLDNAGFMAVQGYLTTYIDSLGYDLTIAALIVAAPAVLALVVAPLAGALSDRFNTCRKLLLTAYIAALIYVWFVFDVKELIFYIPIMVLLTWATGVGSSMQWAACAKALPVDAISGGMAVLTFAQNLGMFAGAAFFGNIVEMLGGDWGLSMHVAVIPMYVIVMIILLVGWKKLP